MKIALFRVVLSLTGILLATASCTTGNEARSDGPFATVGREVSYEQMLNMPPFTAKVETITIDHPFFLRPVSVHLWLKKPDTAWRLDVRAYPASQTVIGFAHSLQVGQSYIFPQAYFEYLNGKDTNAPGSISCQTDQAP